MNASYVEEQTHTVLKMLGLYLYSFTFFPYNGSQILQYVKYTKKTWQKMQNCKTNNGYLDKKVKLQQEAQKIKHKHSCQSQELKPGPRAPKADA